MKRMMIVRVAGTALALCLLALGAMAQSKVGTTAAQFLGISVGPRAIAMGSAYVASNTDVTSLYWNPGAFQMTGKSQLMFSQTNWLVDTKFRWLGFMLNLGDDNAIGVSVTQLDYGEEEVTTVALPEGTGERWSAQDLSVGVSYNRRLTEFFSMGGTIKYIRQQIWNESASGFAFDLGLLFITDFNGLRLGASMTNFGSDLQLDGRDLLTRVDIDPANSGSNKALVGTLQTDPWAMPLTFRVGLAIEVVKEEMFTATLASDAVLPSDMEGTVNFGGEVGWNKMLFVRGGYKSIVRPDAANTEDGFSFGAGLHYAFEGYAGIGFDYAFTDFGAFGNLNTFALSIDF